MIAPRAARDCNWLGYQALWLCLGALVLFSTPDFSAHAADDGLPVTEPTLRMTFYRGPGTTDRDLGPKVCDGDPTTEWIATGLTRTTLGPPFEFVLETLDGTARNLAGVKILAASAAESRRLNEFEIKVETEPGSGDFNRTIYKGQQGQQAVAQSHLFEQPVQVARFQWIVKSNHGDRNEFRVNELWPILDAAQTAQAARAQATESAMLKKVPIRELDPELSAKYPYQPLKYGKLPEIKDATGVNHSAIDTWLARSLAEKQLHFQPQADPVTLIRRLCLNLTGLPPSEELIQTFRKNPTLPNYQRIVEKLLNSPAYGENQARLWLDVVRYADTDGYAADGLRPDAWRYRDYAIAAFNADKPYDRFLTEQLAADELTNAPTDILPALGMARLGPFRTNSGNQNLERNRNELVTEIVSNVSLSFLGLTIGCARCHDHKIDPIPQADYYRFAAYFAAAEPVMLPLATKAQQSANQMQSDKIRRLMEPNEARIQALRGQAANRLRELKKKTLDPATRAALQKPLEARNDTEVALVKVVELELEPKEVDITAALSADEKNAIATAEKALAGLRKQRPAPLPAAWGLKDTGRVAPAAFLLHRGQIEQKTGLVEPRMLSVFSNASASIPQPSKPGDTTTNRRLSLARWLTGPGRAQVARVIVNRIWQQHFGRGIVATSNNFGDLGEEPTHPELLDWLANDFIKNGWSLKKLHRQIVLSQAFRQSSRADTRALEKDPLNELFSRQNRRRLAAEELRDGLLQLSGELNASHRGGPGVAAPLAPEVLQRLKTAWRPTADKKAYQARTIYMLVDRNLVLPILEEFDRPDTMTSCSRRNQSTHALQSLALLNHPWVNQLAEKLGRDAIAQNATSDQARLAWLYVKFTARPPSAEIQAKLLAALNRTKAALALENKGQNLAQAWADIALMLINSNAWLYVD